MNEIECIECHETIGEGRLFQMVYCSNCVLTIIREARNK